MAHTNLQSALIQENRAAAAAATASGPDIEQVLGRIARQASGLGKESADLNGLIDDLAARSGRQAETFRTLVGEIDAMVQANRAISDVTKTSNESVRRARQTVEHVGQGMAGVTNTLAQVATAASEITQIALQTARMRYGTWPIAAIAGSTMAALKWQPSAASASSCCRLTGVTWAGANLS